MGERLAVGAGICFAVLSVMVAVGFVLPSDIEANWRGTRVMLRLYPGYFCVATRPVAPSSYYHVPAVSELWGVQFWRQRSATGFHGHVRVSVWLLWVPSAAAALFGVVRVRFRRAEAALEGKCKRCGYDLSGSASRCPECGHAAEDAVVR